MPSPVVYVVAIISSVAAAIAFKEFVYEPHIAPQIERWAENFIAQRQAKRRQREQSVAILIRQTDTSRTNRPDRATDGGDEGMSSFELERLVATEVDEWRSEVDRSRSGLTRRRRNSSRPGDVLGDSNARLPYPTITPTHVIFDQSPSPTLTEDVAELVSTPPTSPPFMSPHLPAQSTLLSPGVNSSDLPTSDTSAQPGTLRAYLGLLDVLSASSRPDSPFSTLSVPRASTEIPRSLSQVELLSASDDDLDRFSVVSSAASDDPDGDCIIEAVLDDLSDTTSVSSWGDQ